MSVLGIAALPGVTLSLASKPSDTLAAIRIPFEPAIPIWVPLHKVMLAQIRRKENMLIFEICHGEAAR
jgi:hypothetical protein